ncbi:TetR/AcrR family transcriptional regulator [Aureibaculum marinum]|uniref:TetR/AcrR family transcriptional regulator n=1 Tax=Aureibaculum marinum TaxID=2487930 RepID=A0A3N4NRV9_9FLAO|nr:TetR/AcrR family transcriptional regulator [Aureibaculum marinum]RPD95816.1 TetR/AcrR family transcriptional regulator [Aureibaculum marinum]
MKDKILDTATNLFLNYGFKSVTMDDIAHNMGISKKTIYQHYPNKTKLIEASTIYTSNVINNGINQICKLNKNPIEEVYEIKRFVMKYLKNEKTSPQYQLQKYYPKIFEKLKKNKFNIMISCVKENLMRGISENLYRDSININFIATIYFHNVLILKDQEYFSAKEFSISELMDHYLEYHLRGLCTPKGLKILNKIIDKKQLN